MVALQHNDFDRREREVELALISVCIDTAELDREPNRFSQPLFPASDGDRGLWLPITGHVISRRFAGRLTEYTLPAGLGLTSSSAWRRTPGRICGSEHGREARDRLPHGQYPHCAQLRHAPRSFGRARVGRVSWAHAGLRDRLILGPSRLRSRGWGLRYVQFQPRGITAPAPRIGRGE